MLCVASFIVFLILGIFSATHRELAGKAWYCVSRKIRFKPCDINFNEELKGKLLGKLIFTHPKFAKVLDKWIDVISFVFVVVSIWSIFAVSFSGLNLWVYDTCNPNSGEACSLGGEACTVSSGSLGFFESLREGKILDWGVNHITTFGETVSRVPDRFRTWKVEEYINETNSYYREYDATKPLALEIVDPGCIYCARLLQNIERADFMNTHNLTYIAYPIPDPKSQWGYKFRHSYLIARYLEAMKMRPLEGEIPTDWQLLHKLYVETSDRGIEWQFSFNEEFDDEQAKEQLRKFLKEFGYSEEVIADVEILVDSEEVKARVKENSRIVEDEVKTIKIPTIMFDGRRYDRVVDVETLQK